MAKNGFFDLFFKNLPAAQKIWPKQRLFTAWGELGKINFIDLKNNGRQSFRKFFENPPPRENPRLATDFEHRSVAVSAKKRCGELPWRGECKTFEIHSEVSKSKLNVYFFIFLFVFHNNKNLRKWGRRWNWNWNCPFKTTSTFTSE